MRITKIKSIKGRLLAYLMSLISIVWLAVALSSFVWMQKGAAQIIDVQLEQIAKALAEMPPFSDSDMHDGEEKVSIDSSSQASPVYFQIWRKGKLDISTMNITIPDIDKIPLGFSSRKINNQIWRLYLYQSRTAPDRTIITATKTINKKSFIDPLVEIVGFHLITEIIAIILIIIFSVNKSLQTIRLVVNDVTNKNYNNLDPISLSDIPSEMLPLGEALNALLIRLRKSILMEREFTSHAAHELKTPLAALKMQAQVALNENDSSLQKQQIEKIIDGVNRANHVVSQMLLLARYEGDVSLPKETVCLSEHISIAIESINHLIFQNKINIEKIFYLTPFVKANGDSLQVLIKNILDNAVRYSPEGSTIKIKIENCNSKICLSVEDQGPSIPHNLRDKIFERFYRGKSKNNPEGSGLGLSLVKRIAEINVIDIEIEPNQCGHGNSFKLTFSKI